MTGTRFSELLATGFIAITAIPCGALLAWQPDGHLLQLDLQWLQYSPFSDFLIPGLILMVVVGGSSLVAFVRLLRRRPNAYNWCLTAGIMLTGWIIVQMMLLRLVYWLHILYLVVGGLVLLIAWQQKGKTLV